MNIFLVIPTIRSLDFLEAWGDLLSSCSLVIIEDHPAIQIPTPKGNYKHVFHYCWADIAHDFGSDEWIFSRKNAGIRSYGFWKAYEQGADIIMTLDDDCFPVDKDLVEQHRKNLELKAPQRWSPSFPDRQFLFTRGFPYQDRGTYPVVVSHGLWTNKIDLDGKTQLTHPDINLPAYPSLVQFVPRGMYFPMCSMNLAFRRAAAPLMYFPLMGYDSRGNHWGYDRFDDIWAGVFAKKICDHLGLAVVNGSPFVEHKKASDPLVNMKKETNGLKTNERLWQLVDGVKLTQKTPATCYSELAKRMKFPNEPYFVALRRAMLIWARLFQV